MPSPYRRVLSVPGALAFSLAALVARLPLSMVSLGIVLLVSTRTGSYQVAGVVAAAYLVGQAVFAVVQGRLADRLGQARLLPATVTVFAASLAAMVWAVEAGWPAPVPHLLAAVGGAAMPQIGSCVRARWSHNVADKQLLQSAFALEAVFDEVVFMLGPVVVTVLATSVHPAAGLLTALGCGFVGSLLLAAQRSTEPPAHRGTGRRGAREPMGWPVLGPVVVVGLGMGMVFGGMEVATVAFAEERGAKAVSGVLLGVFALGSLLSGYGYGLVRWRAASATRFRWGVAWLAAALVPLPFVEGFWLLGAALLLAGGAISPTMIACVSWIEETVPARRLTEGITLATTGISVGLAPGAALVGAVVDRYGASASFWVPVAAAGLSVAVAASTVLTTTRTATR